LVACRSLHHIYFGIGWGVSWFPQILKFKLDQYRKAALNSQNIRLTP
jgi:hypothetical protein